MPGWQHHGFGFLLVQASYEITRREGALGRPEEPLSEGGWAVYWKYWRHAILRLGLGCGAHSPVRALHLVGEAPFHPIFGRGIIIIGTWNMGLGL